MQIARSIRGMSVSWAQGLSYALVDEYHEELAAEDVDDDEEEEEEEEGEGEGAEKDEVSMSAKI